MRRVVSLPVGLFLAGCGVIFNGTSTSVPVDSDPQGVEVWVDEARAGVTPLHVRLDHGSDHKVVFKRRGHPDQVVHVQRKLDGGYVALDVLFTGLVGIVIDAATGGWYTPDPASINVLGPEVATAAAGPADAATTAKSADVATPGTELVNVPSPAGETK
jgi:hypothetical protein